jgi:DNA-binding PadR family transcriptional regulator
MTGYRIRQVVSETIGYFWQESFGQIYPALKRLHAGGFVTRRVHRQRGKPDRHEYSITAKGRAQLEQWLAQEPDPERVRHELLLKLFFGRQGDAKDLLHHVDKYADRQESLLESYSFIRAHYFKEMPEDPGQPYWELTLTYGEHLAKARLQWARETVKVLKNLEKGSQQRKGG